MMLCEGVLSTLAVSVGRSKRFPLFSFTFVLGYK